MIKKIIAIMVVSIAFFIGCNASLKDYPREKCVAMPSDDVVKAIHDNCIKCHTKDFSTGQEICERKNRIIDAVSRGRMPKIGKLFESYKETIVKWK